MRFFKNQDPIKNNSQSIVKTGDVYMYKSSGIHLGSIVVNLVQRMEIEMGIYCQQLLDLMKENNVDIKQVYFNIEISRMYDRYEEDTYEVNVYKNHNIMELPFGVFHLSLSNDGYFFKEFHSELDPGLIIPNKPLKQMVMDFYNNSISSGRKNKKGFLLYGAPGNGKTTDIMSLFQLAKQEKMRIFIVSRKVDFSDLDLFKQLLEKDRSIFILEEITQRTDREGTEELLTFLDGENSWNNCVVIATTNYAEDLPANLVDRPGRFDTFIEYVGPNRDQVVELAAKFGFTEDDVRCLMNEDLSYDYVSFILSQAKVLSKSPKETIQIERDKKARISKTFKGKMGLGF